MLLSIASAVLVALVSFVQTTNLIFVGGIKPNLVLALLGTIAHYSKNWFVRTFLILLSALILKFSPAITWIDIIFIFTALLVVALTDYLPWRRAINSVSAVVIGTIIMNLSHFNLSLIAFEMIFNAVLTLIFFIILEYSYGKKKKQIKNRL